QDHFKNADDGGGIPVPFQQQDPAQRHHGDVNDLRGKDDEHVSPEGGVVEQAIHRDHSSTSGFQIPFASAGPFPAARRHSVPSIQIENRKQRNCCPDDIK